MSPRLISKQKFLKIGLAFASFFLLPGIGFALTVSPVKIEITGDPGKTVYGEFSLLNEQQEIKTFYSSAENFDAQGEEGTPHFIPGKTGLASWVDVTPSVTIEPGELKSFTFSIAVPENAEPGGHFAAIFWGTTPPAQTENSEVSVGAKVGILVLLKVSGEVKEGGGLVEFGVDESLPFHESLPVTLFYRFRNTGGDRIKPEGTIAIKNMFGMTVKTFSANPSEGNVLPLAVRRYEVPWGEPLKDDAPSGFFSVAKRQLMDFHAGRYTAELNLQYGKDNELSAAKDAEFLIIPWQILSLALAGLVVLWLIFRTGLRRYNRWIIRNATGQSGMDEFKGSKSPDKYSESLRL